MAYKVKDYGNGSLGDVNSISATINSYARVTAISSSTITINSSTQITGTATFEVGAKVLIHVSATTSSSYKTYLGCYLLANVTAVNGDVLTLDENPTTCIPAANFSQYYVQAIAVAQYKNLTLPAGVTITPPVYSAVSYIGGIVALMCSESLVFNGGHISLSDRGIPVASKDLRPTMGQNDVVDDINDYSGMENDCSQRFLLNAGDGATFIIAKSMTCNTASRIGNITTYGVQFYRGATNSVTYNESKPSGTNVGGSSILIAAENIVDFTPRMIAKYRLSSSMAGQGVCRCYIASETKLRNDEGLYAYDCISDKKRLQRKLNIKNFGNGSFGDVTNYTSKVNNYACITAIDGNKVTYTSKTTDGLAPIETSALVMIHWNQKGTTHVEHAGRFILAKVLSDNGTVLTLDTTPPDISISDYAAQIVSIPQFDNFTMNSSYNSIDFIYGRHMASFGGSFGGIYAIAVKDTCSISHSKISVADRSSYASAYGREGLSVIGNAQDSDKMPIGSGRGSIFILANNLICTAGWLGNNFQSNYYGKYRGQSDSYGGSGATNGTGSYNGGYGGNGSFLTAGETYYVQGAHIMVVANTITDFHTSFLSTSGGYGYQGVGCGGNSGWRNDSEEKKGGYNGGAGGTSNNRGSGGGSSGWAFVYCNEAVNQDTTGTVLDN